MGGKRDKRARRTILFTSAPKPWTCCDLKPLVITLQVLERKRRVHTPKDGEAG